MSIIWIVLASVTFLVVTSVFVVLVWGTRQIRGLDDVDPSAADHWPLVSVIVPARNEQRGIESALTSLLHLDYDNLEILVIDDRSTDDTGAILDRLAAGQRKLTVFHLDELPAGWLGKNHALFYGSERARGEYLLFTDADVVMDPSTLRRAMVHALDRGLDHLTISPEAKMPTAMLSAFVVVFINLFALHFRLWKVSDPKSPAFVGIGAFNLLRREVYQAIGTHRTIAMRPDDDVKLGKIVKVNGFRQDILNGTNLISVVWYASMDELITGLEKNAFAGVDYRVSTIVTSACALFACDIWPFMAIWILAGPARVLYAATVVVLLGHTWLTARELRVSPAVVPLFPVAVLLLIYIQWRAMVLTYVRGGIYWRDTHYSLAELRANKV